MPDITITNPDGKVYEIHYLPDDCEPASGDTRVQVICDGTTRNADSVYDAICMVRDFA